MANEDQQRRRRRVRVIWAAVIAAAVIAIVLTLLPKPTEADFATVDRGTLRVELVDEGRTRMHDIYVISAPVAGRLLRVEVEPGDSVAAETVLVRIVPAAAGFLDPRSERQARAAVEAAQANVRAAWADLQLKERDAERTRDLAQQKLVARSVLDNSETALLAARAAHDAAQAELVRARAALLSAERSQDGLVEVLAPVPGSVLRIHQKSEAVVPVGAAILDLGDPAHIEVVAEFLSQDAVRMRPGQRARIENWGGDPLPAVVERIEPVARTKISALGVEEQRTNVILQFEDRVAGNRLGHDFRVDAHVILEELPDVVRAPLGALFRNGDQWATYQVVDGRAQLTAVEVGPSDGEFRQIVSGLEPGATVIVFPGTQIVDDLRVVARGT